MRAFRTRYERKQNRIMVDDDLMSEYAPSELSELLANEEVESEYDEEEEDDDFEGEEEEVVDVKMTDEQLQEEAVDNANITMETIYPGDNENFPMTGDICRLVYTCTLVSSGKIISSTKNAMGKCYLC